jgi:Lon protease-like protein
MSYELPLFPLGTLLFPGGTINLHIFEERYREMIGYCLEHDSPFGVVLLHQGHEVEEGNPSSSGAEPYAIGTVARISANVRLEDGRYLLTAIGQQRFRIKQIRQRVPYIIAEVEEIPDVVSAGAVAAAAELRKTYDRYWQAIAVATGMPAQGEELSEDPVEMSYDLADRLQVLAQRKQQWLATDLLTRLREINNNLRAELLILPRARQTDSGNESEGWDGMISLN